MTAALAPNAAIPLGLRRRQAFDASTAVGHAAGVIYVAPDGDVLLLRRSPAEENFGGHWALPGGGVDNGETPEVGAARESREEIGVEVDPKRFKVFDQTMTPTGKAFHTFAMPVEKKFWPKINDEHVGAGWFPLSELPRPIHPAVEKSLQTRLGINADMTPEDWAGLRDGFLKWTAEEEAEGAHDDVLATDPPVSEAQRRAMWAAAKGKSTLGIPQEVGKEFVGDSALRIAMDRASVRTTDRDGHLHVAEANVCKACVSPYRGSEIPNWQHLGLEPDRVYQMLRPPEELEKAATSINGKPLLRVHKPTSADDHQSQHVAGAVGTQARWEHPFIKNGLTIWDGRDIEGIESKRKYELSPGYRYRAVMQPGTYEGDHFDGKMVDIAFNHLCLVEEGRQGDDVVIGDSALNFDVEWSELEDALLSLGV